MKPIISIKEARKLLGSEYKDKSDEEIEKLIEDVDQLAHLALEVAKEQVPKIIDLYKRLDTYLKVTQFYKRHAGNDYLKDGLKKIKLDTRKLEYLLANTAIQKELYGNWLEIRDDISKDPVGYVLKNKPESLFSDHEIYNMS